MSRHLIRVRRFEISIEVSLALGPILQTMRVPVEAPLWTNGRPAVPPRTVDESTDDELRDMFATIPRTPIAFALPTI